MTLQSTSKVMDLRFNLSNTQRQLLDCTRVALPWSKR